MSLSDKSKLYENKKMGSVAISAVDEAVSDIQKVIEFLIEYETPVDKIVEFLKHTQVTEEDVLNIKKHNEEARSNLRL